MRRRKSDYIEDYIIIAAAVTLLVIIMIIAILAIRSNTPVNKPLPIPTLSPVVSEVTPVPQFSLDNDAEGRLAKRILNKQALTPSDKAAKDTMLNTILHGYQSGIVYKSQNEQIEYVESADLFQVEIFTTDIAAAKSEANIWFRDQGFSQQAICDLPVMFYLDLDVMGKLRGKNYIFSPVANSC